jgi:sulfite reductase (NADPH) flavoprotein alpha-component
MFEERQAISSMQTPVQTASPVAGSRQHPYPATLMVRQKVTLPGSEKETYRYELDVGGIEYEPGDSLGVFPVNSPELVRSVLQRLGASGREVVKGKDGESRSLYEVLLRQLTITRLSGKFVQALSERVGSARFLDARNMADRHATLEEFQYGRDLRDVLDEYPETREQFSPQDLVDLLPKLQPRLYSIASSRKVCGSSAHLLVTSVSYPARGGLRHGVCTSYLADRASGFEPISVFVHRAKYFHLPDDPGMPLIMVGVGCGIAPFRGFLQERDAGGMQGKTWLFFGEQHESTDFYYRKEWEDYLSSGVLSRMDTAFSRDQGYKIYVQHRMVERAHDLWAWLEKGATIYVCGDADRMAPGVDAALHEIVQHAGGLDKENAREYVARLRREKRYRRDVY